MNRGEFAGNMYLSCTVRVANVSDRTECNYWPHSHEKCSHQEGDPGLRKGKHR